MNKPIRRVELVEGGNVVKQGEHFTLGFHLFDADGGLLTPVEDISVKIANRSGVVYETTGAMVNNRLEFSVTEDIGNGEMRVEITISNGSTVIQKYPADDWIRIKVTPSFDDLGYSGVNTITVTQLQNSLTKMQNDYKTIVDSKVSAISSKADSAIAKSVDAEGKSTDALGKSTDALTTSTDAKNIAESVKAEFDEVVAEAGSNNAEVVQARDGEVNLKARLDKTTAQLAQTLKQTDLDNGLIAKRDKATPIALLDFSDEAKQAIAGTASIFPSFSDGSVTPLKTTFMKRGKNLFDKNKVTVGYRLNAADGALVADVNFNITDYIFVLPNMNYIKNGGAYALSFYTASKVFISSVSTSIFLTPSNAYYVRITIKAVDTPVIQVEQGTITTTYEAYREYLAKELFDPSYVPTIPIGHITDVKQTTFITLGKNLFDKSVAYIGYVNQTNGVIDNLGTDVNYKVTDFIPVKSNTSYTRSHDGRTAFYDVNKVFISGHYDATFKTKTLIAPTNAVFMRATLYKIDVDVYQVEEGTSTTSYEPYIHRFIKNNEAIDVYADDIVLPPTISAVVGKEVNIYFENIVILNSKDYQFDVTCVIGKQQNERWTCVPALSGTYPLSIALYKDGVYKNSVSTNIVVKSNSVGDGVNKKMLIIGDSTVNGGVTTLELLKLFDADVMNLTLLGTRGIAPNLHEGRGGWSVDLYVNQSTDGKLTNPFYSNGFNFANYMTTQGYTGVDIVGINLGINDTFPFTDNVSLNIGISAMLPKFQTMIDNIKAYDSNIKIAVFITIPPSYHQDNFGDDYGNGQTRWRYKKNNFIWVKSLINYFKGKEAQGIYLVPINVNLDTENNMAYEMVAVNSRNSKQVARQNDGVHPAPEGYNQSADIIYYWLKSMEV